MSGALGSLWRLAFEASPIVLTGGLANSLTGGMLPIIALTEAANFTLGLLSGANINLDNLFAHFQPLPGSNLIDIQVGTYPFANQNVAANATIVQPLALSMMMICPARNELGYPSKLATFIALKTALDQHNTLGGTYTVITPTYYYTNGILTSMRDISSGETHQPQVQWQLDFTFPLLTLEAAQQAQNSLMSKLTAGTQVSGQPSWTGVGATVGDPNSLAAPALVPSAQTLPASNTAPFAGI